MNATDQVTLRRRLLCWGSVICLAAWLAGCGGSSSGDAAQPPIDSGGVTIGAGGGTVTNASGAAVIVPPGAFTAEATIRVAIDSSGAPVLPEGLVAAGNVYMITPHGGDFAQPVEVRIPAPNVTLQPNQELKLAKAQPGGEWEVLGDSHLQDGQLVAQVSNFSFFFPVTVTYQLPVLQREPFRVTQFSLRCGDQRCDQAIESPATPVYTVNTNNGQLPANCSAGEFVMQQNGALSLSRTSIALPLSGRTGTLDPIPQGFIYPYVVGLRCETFTITMSLATVWWRAQPRYPDLEVLRAAAQLDVIAGLGANLDVILGGAASGLRGFPAGHSAPTAVNRAIIDWQRSDDSGASWRVIARSFQDEANPNPVGDGFAWRYWSVRHGFIAAASDQGSWVRVQACYTPPDVAPAPCVTSAPTRINVLQQSALPSIVDAPRSVLVRTGQTASLSATAGGAPAPTLQWQTRAANDNGAWADMAGATGGSHTTAVLGLADNGRQYRVVASNPLGSAASAAVTVSVSDLDVAPTITTQPASLSVASGSDAAFAIAAQGTEALSYQWRFNGIAISGANSTVLRLGAVSAGQAGLYSVVVSNSAGTLTSGDASLVVSASGVPPTVAPSIVTQPALVSVGAGQTATFAVGASGSAPLAYEWLRDGVPIAGATDVYYRIASATTGDTSTYSVRVSNSAGEVTSASAQLFVSPEVVDQPVSISTHPSPQAQPPGGSATFAVAANGSGPFSYQWLKDGAQIPGATAGVLILNNLSSGDAASYSVSVLNSRGNVYSNAASLTIIGAPAIGSQPAPASATEGQQATFSVAASGSGLRYQWTRNHVAIGGATAAGYTTPLLALADSGAVYGVVVYNGAGVVFSQPAVLTVTPAVIAPSVTLQPLGTTVADGSPANLDVAFAGTAPFSVQPQRFVSGAWANHGSAVTVNDNNLVRFSTGSLSAAGGPYEFRYVASNASGSVATASATVTVTAASAGVLALVANSSANTLSIFRADAGTGALSALGTTGTGAYPYAIAITPNGQFAYVTNLVGNNVSSYSINASAGTVTMVGSSVNSVNPYGIAMDPLGRFVWAVNYSASSVSAYTINGSTGQLTSAGAPVATGTFPYAVAVHPNGNYVYVANEMGNSVSAYSVNASTGQLTLLAGTIANSAFRPHSIAVDPTGRFVYVTESGGSGVAAFSISAGTGVLTVVGYVNSGGSAPSAVAVHPNGQFVYVANQSSSTVAVFSVNSSSGALTAVGSPIATGSSPIALSVNAAGSHLYVANLGANSASAFSVNASTGALTSLGASVATGSGPQGIAVTP